MANRLINQLAQTTQQSQVPRPQPQAPRPQQAPQPVQPQTKQPAQPRQTIDWAGFRSFALKKLQELQLAPKEHEKAVGQLKETIDRRARQELVREGVGDLEKLSGTDPTGALRLKREGFEPVPKVSGERQKTLEARTDLLEAAKSAKSILDEYEGKKDVTGFFPMLLRQKREGFGLVSPESTRMMAAIADVATKYAFGTGGKQFTETELRLIRPLLPRPEDGENVVGNKLNALVEFLEDQGIRPRAKKQGGQEEPTQPSSVESYLDKYLK